MLEAEELDGVVAPLQFSEHASLLPDLYRGCRHVLTEKPVAVRPQTGQQLAEAARAAGCVHMVGYHKRADPAVAWAIGQIQRWQANGEAGELRYVRITISGGDWMAGGNAGYLASEEPPTQTGSETPPPELGDEVGKKYVDFINFYSHQVNLLRYLLGEPYRVSHVDPKGILLVAESESGRPAILEMTPYQTEVAWDEEALIAFEHGYVRVVLPPPLARFRPGRAEAYLDRRGGPEPRREIPTLPHVDAMAAQAARFVQVCKDEAEPFTSVAEAAEDLAVAYDYITQRFSPDLAGAEPARP
jgi:predicted dehydrogenase